MNYCIESQKPEHRELAFKIQFTAFNEAGGIYDERHAKLYADLALDMIDDGSFSILYENAAHACYTPITIDADPHLKCLSPTCSSSRVSVTGLGYQAYGYSGKRASARCCLYCK